MNKMPTANGYFGIYGGKFVPETLVNALGELEKAYNAFRKDRAMRIELKSFLSHYAGRPTPLYYAANLSHKCGIEIFLKREDLLHTGAHKLNNTLGQGLLARFMGKKRLIAETGAGQHGVATATVAALLGMKCTVYMGNVDMKRQAPNVARMRLLGAEVVPVESGSGTLKDAINAALRDWVKNVRHTHYCIGSVVGPHPFPMIVRNFQSIIGKEARSQMYTQVGKNPDFVVGCVGGGSNAVGIFSAFLRLPKTKLIGVEAGGFGTKPGQHSARFAMGRRGILHGCITYVLQNKDCQILPVHSISAGLDYPAVGPEHAFFHDEQIVEYVRCSDSEALRGCLALSKFEGIIPALESSHAVGYVLSNRKRFKGCVVLVNLSGRGDKDMDIIAREAKL
ncbi:MAG: tryptophan synthase subunit beta [Spirochaetes bacterium]|nr:tryptophan synthase subunit beta [Spirochaetota bacterium]